MNEEQKQFNKIEEEFKKEQELFNKVEEELRKEKENFLNETKINKILNKLLNKLENLKNLENNNYKEMKDILSNKYLSNESKIKTIEFLNYIYEKDLVISNSKDLEKLIPELTEKQMKQKEIQVLSLLLKDKGNKQFQVLSLLLKDKGNKQFQILMFFLKKIENEESWKVFESIINRINIIEDKTKKTGFNIKNKDIILKSLKFFFQILISENLSNELKISISTDVQRNINEYLEINLKKEVDISKLEELPELKVYTFIINEQIDNTFINNVILNIFSIFKTLDSIDKKEKEEIVFEISYIKNHKRQISKIENILYQELMKYFNDNIKNPLEDLIKIFKSFSFIYSLFEKEIQEEELEGVSTQKTMLFSFFLGIVKINNQNQEKKTCVNFIIYFSKLLYIISLINISKENRNQLYKNFMNYNFLYSYDSLAQWDKILIYNILKSFDLSLDINLNQNQDIPEKTIEKINEDHIVYKKLIIFSSICNFSYEKKKNLLESYKKVTKVTVQSIYSVNVYNGAYDGPFYEESDKIDKKYQKYMNTILEFQNITFINDLYKYLTKELISPQNITFHDIFLKKAIEEKGLTEIIGLIEKLKKIIDFYFSHYFSFNINVNYKDLDNKTAIEQTYLEFFYNNLKKLDPKWRILIMKSEILNGVSKKKIFLNQFVFEILSGDTKKKK